MNIDPTDVERLPVPQALQTDPLVGTREQRIWQHSGKVAWDWWKFELDVRHLPGGPLLIHERRSSSGELQRVLSRGDVFALAHDLDDEEAVLRLLWHAMAWGSGIKPRNNRRRLTSIAAQRDAVAVALRDAALLARCDPEAAYELFRSGGHNAVKHLGPAYFSKFLYFAGGGSQNHPCLILDQRVAAVLHDEGCWSSLLPTHGWSAWTYRRYCRLVTRWAVAETVRRHRVVCPDEIEKWLWERGKPDSARRSSSPAAHVPAQRCSMDHV